MIEHARQNSRANRLLDTFNRCLYMSDPVISTINIDKRVKKENEKNNIIKEVINSVLQKYYENDENL